MNGDDAYHLFNTGGKMDDYALVEMTITPNTRLRINFVMKEFLIQEFKSGDAEWTTVSKALSYPSAMALFIANLLQRLANGFFG